jgi:NAD(P)-dependent dehydrogenase (short-subunit alcohol dehydrogenase family)
VTAALPDYRGKRVVVTGSSSGIGAATASALVGLGAEVHGAARDTSVPGLASHTDFDLSDPASVEAAVGSIGGPVDALFNCAGAVPMLDPLTIVKVNFLGTRLLTELVVELMGPGGAVVNVSSDAGHGWRRKHDLIAEFLREPTFDAGLAWFEANQEKAGQAYGFGKEALTVWTMQRSAVLIGRGIRINAVSPGAVQTPMLEAIEDAYSAAAIEPVAQPIGRRSSAEEQVGALLFLNSAAASYVNGVDLPVDGGFWAAQTLAGRFH